jgi:hypothetical protein
MKLYWLACTLLAIPVSGKRKTPINKPDSDVIYGACAPLGPLSNSFIAKLRLPGFPFEFPPILPGTRDRYLIFPAPDTVADYEASVRRCAVYNGKLVDLQTPTEMEILACAIGTPSFIGNWFEGGKHTQCNVLYPGGVVSISEENCKGFFGSICKVPGSMVLDGFQV